MKKLLFSLLAAPLAMTSCVTVTDNNGNNITPITQLDIFGNTEVSVETVNNWFTTGHAENLKTGVFAQTGTNLDYNMKKSTIDLYSFTNIDGTSKANLGAGEAYDAFKASLENIDAHNDTSNPSAIPSNYSNLIKTGQVKKGSAQPADSDTILNADFDSIAKTAPTYGKVSMFDLSSYASNIASTFNQNGGFTNTFLAGAPGNTQNPTGGLTMTDPSLASLQNVELPAGTNVTTPATQWVSNNSSNVSIISTQFQTLAGIGGDQLNWGTLSNPTNNIKSADGQPFISWYIHRYIGNPANAASGSWNHFQLRIAQFHGNGQLQADLGAFRISGDTQANLDAGLNQLKTWTINPAGYAITAQPNLTGVEANRKLGISLKSSIAAWTFKADNLNGKIILSDTELKNSFDYWLAATLLPSQANSTGNGYEIKMDGTNYSQYSDLDALYKAACLKAKEMIEEGNAVFTNSCPN